MSRVAVIGCGVIGSSWALVFSRAGFNVSIYDASPSAQQEALAFVRASLTDLQARGLAGEDPLEAVMARLTTNASLEKALVDVVYIQESASERLEIKRELYQQLDALAAPDVTIGSSTSGLPASAFTNGLTNAHRCLVVHPINPPHLIPLVEIVPAPWTAPETVDQASNMMRQVGQLPIRLTREINGFVVNRLQSAVLSEAFRLVEDGICEAVDIDRAVSDGLGLRWFFMGPFETIDLNSHNGVVEYCNNFGPMYYGLAKEQADPRPWSSVLVKTVEEQRRYFTPADQLPARRMWRDRCLAALVSAKQRILTEQRS